MSTEPVAPPPVAPTPPPSDPPEVVAVRAAEEAQRHFAAAATAATQKAESAEARAARLEAELAELKTKLGSIDVVAQAHEREAQSQRLAALRRMGLDERLGDAHALALAPKVDPRDPSGLVALEQWRQANASLFKAQGPTEAQVIERLSPRLQQLPKSGLFSAEKLLTRVMRGGK